MDPDAMQAPAAPTGYTAISTQLHHAPTKRLVTFSQKATAAADNPPASCHPAIDTAAHVPPEPNTPLTITTHPRAREAQCNQSLSQPTFPNAHATNSQPQRTEEELCQTEINPLQRVPTSPNHRSGHRHPSRLSASTLSSPPTTLRA